MGRPGGPSPDPPGGPFGSPSWRSVLRTAGRHAGVGVPDPLGTTHRPGRERQARRQPKAVRPKATSGGAAPTPRMTSGPARRPIHRRTARKVSSALVSLARTHIRLPVSWCTTLITSARLGALRTTAVPNTKGSVAFQRRAVRPAPATARPAAPAHRPRRSRPPRPAPAAAASSSCGPAAGHSTARPHAASLPLPGEGPHDRDQRPDGVPELHHLALERADPLGELLPGG
jgi:hypothetical protein